MAVQVPVYSGNIPSRMDSQQDLNTNMSNMFGYIGGNNNGEFVPSLNALAMEVESHSSEVETAKDEAVSAAATALAASGAGLYLGSSTYNSGDIAIDSIVFQPYVCRVDNTTGVQPSTDDTGTWVRLLLGGNNPNLFINSDLEHNQENYAADGVASISSGSYGHDMLKCDSDVGGSVIYTKNGPGDFTINSFTCSGVGYVNIRQINDELKAANGEILTISFEVVSLDNSLELFTATETHTISTIGLKTFTVTGDSIGGVSFFRYFNSAGTYVANLRIRNLKVERGPVATQWVRPEPRAEKARCEYEYQIVGGGIPVPESQAVGFGYGRRIMIPLSNPIKETLSTINTTGGAYLELRQESGSNYPVTGISVVKVLTNAVWVDVSVTGSPSMAVSCLLLASSSGTGVNVLELDVRS